MPAKISSSISFNMIFYHVCFSISTMLLTLNSGHADRFERAEILSELPMRVLLQKRRSAMLDLMSCNASTAPVAEALVNPLGHMQVRMKGGVRNGWPQRDPTIDRGQFFEDTVEEPEEEEEEEEIEWMPMAKGKGKIGQIFDISVTALSFLAFGGYLLCLIIHVINEKKEEEMSAMSTASTMQTPNLQYFVPAKRPVVPIRVPVGQVYRPGRRKRSNYDVPLRQEDELLQNLIESGLLLAKTFTNRR